MRADTVAGLLEPLGLVLLGSFAVTDEDRIPALNNGLHAGELLLIGNAGSSFWNAFSSSPEYRDGGPDPLDRWSRRVAGQLAADLGGQALFPFGGPPYLPFQAWAQRTGQAAPSRIAMVMHARYGLWHAYRFALALPRGSGSEKDSDHFSDLIYIPAFKSPCIECTDQPCLKACPVDAFSGEGYAVDQCVEYLANDRESACRTLGCEARRSCPVAREFTYLPGHARFHMEAFVRSTGPDSIRIT